MISNTVVEGSMTCVHFLQYLELKVVLLYHYLSIILCIYAWLTCILFELPLSSPFPGVLSMFVMDNARIHHGEGILELAEIYGKFVEIYSITRAYFYSVNVRIEFLPPFTRSQSHWGSLLEGQGLHLLSLSPLGIWRWWIAVWFDRNNGCCDSFQCH